MKPRGQAICGWRVLIARASTGGDVMKMSNEALRIVSQEHLEQTGIGFARSAGPHPGDGLKPSKSADLRADIDDIKREIRESLLRIDMVKEAKSLVVDESQRAETLNRRFAEIDALTNLLNSESLKHGTMPQENSEILRSKGLDSDMAETRMMSNRSAGEGVAIAWPKAEGLQQHAGSSEERAQSYESASRRLEAAEKLQREVAEMSAYAQLRMVKAELCLAEARAREEAAATDLLSARQELTTAYQFAAVSAQRRLESAQFFERTAQWAVFASLFSWIATVWLVWIALMAFHKNTSILMPILGTIVLVLGGVVLVKRRIRKSESQ